MSSGDALSSRRVRSPQRLLLLVYLFVNADPARLAHGLKVTGIVIAVLAVATLAVSGRLAALLMPLAMLMPR